MNDVLVKTAINLGLVVVGAVVAWYVPVLMLLGLLGGLVLGLRTPSSRRFLVFGHTTRSWRA